MAGTSNGNASGSGAGGAEITLPVVIVVLTVMMEVLLLVMERLMDKLVAVVEVEQVLAEVMLVAHLEVQADQVRHQAVIGLQPLVQV